MYRKEFEQLTHQTECFNDGDGSDTSPEQIAIRHRSTIAKKHGSPFEYALRHSGGKPFVFEDGGMRYLHFDERFVQSAMYDNAPDELTLDYTRVMMGFLLFQPEPKHILMVGLGGGSLAKYCYRYLPTTKITVLEINADVIALRGKFSIPPDDLRFEVVHVDAAEYIAKTAHDYDVVLLDGYDADGLESTLTSDNFYANCRRLLSPCGILVSNLSCHDPNFAVLMARMHNEYGWDACGCQATNSNNVIVFAHYVGGNAALAPMLKKHARQLGHHVGLNLQELAKCIDKNPVVNMHERAFEEV